MNSSYLQRKWLYSLIAALFVFSACASAQTLTITAGNGQLTNPATPAPQALTVQLLQSNGQPFTGQTITFAIQTTSALAGNLVNPSNGTCSGTSCTVVTDSNGNASITWIGSSLTFGTSVQFSQDVVVATYGSTSVFFYETVSNITTGGGSLVTAALTYPIPGSNTVLTGAAGTTGAQPISVLVSVPTNQTSSNLANIAMTITTDPNSTGSISCKEGPYVLTNSAGIATCTPLFGKVGTGTFTIVVGGGRYTFVGNSFNVTPGGAGMVTVTSGNNQSGTPGQTLPQVLVATVTDLAGNILSGVNMVFTVSPANGATFTNSRLTSDTSGHVSTNVVLGNIAGPIQISVTDAAGLIKTPAVFTETVNIAISSLSKVSGDGQSALTNAAFGQPLVVQVNNSTNQAVSGATVAFSVSSGSATLSQSSVVTGADGKASVNVTAGPNAGPVVITASTSGFTVTFNLTVNPPGPTNFSYFNGASNQANSLSPGSVATITAQGLVNNNVQGVISGPEFGPLLYTVAGVSVTLSNIPAPIFNVQNLNGQQSVTIQVPFEVSAGTVPITIGVSGSGSTNAFVTLMPYSPGFFQEAQADGVTRAVALRPNGTVVTPTNPAGRGENIRIYLTGLGAVSPAVATGSYSPAASADPVVSAQLLLGLNNAGIPFVQAIYARNLIGAYEVTFTVPTDTAAFPSGSLPLSVAVLASSGPVFSNPSSIVIQ